MYIVDKENAKIKEVSVGLRMERMVEIENGLDINDKVIVLGHEKLKDGSKIKTLNW